MLTLQVKSSQSDKYFLNIPAVTNYAVVCMVLARPLFFVPRDFGVIPTGYKRQGRFLKSCSTTFPNSFEKPIYPFTVFIMIIVFNIASAIWCCHKRLRKFNNDLYHLDSIVSFPAIRDKSLNVIRVSALVYRFSLSSPFSSFSTLSYNLLLFWSLPFFVSLIHLYWPVMLSSRFISFHFCVTDILAIIEEFPSFLVRSFFFTALFNRP